MFVLQSLSPENSEKIYEVEDVLEAFDGLHKAARSDYTGNLTLSHTQALHQVRFGFPSSPAE